jgi:hypothetical protein
VGISDTPIGVRGERHFALAGALAPAIFAAVLQSQ